MTTFTRILPKIIEWAQEHTRAGYIHSLHHWNHVADYGQMLCDRLEAEGQFPNRRVVLLFAYLHDSCRANDHGDYEHGPRAAKAIGEIRHNLLQDLSDEEFEMLRTAIRLHTSADRTGNITIDVCFDSDRLDLDRVGIMPDPDYLATSVAGQYVTQHSADYFQRLMEREEQ